MNKILLITVLTLVCSYVNAQDQFTLRLKDTKGQPLRNTEVVALNATANDRLTGRTDANGSVTFTFTQVGVYKMSFLEVKDAEEYEVKEGMRGSGSTTKTYDPELVFAKIPRAERKGVTFTTLAGIQLKGKPNTTKITLMVAQPDHIPVASAAITVVSVSDGLKLTGKTDVKGAVVFYLYAGKTYEVDIDGYEAIEVFQTVKDPNIESTEFVYYEKTKVTEIAKGDTIIQRNITQKNGTNTHLMFTLNLRDLQGLPLEGEPVYLQAEGGKLVYEGVTNAKGECKMMLSKNNNYIVNLKYEQGLHLVEAKKMVGFGQESITRRYRGSKEIERIVAEQLAEIRRIEEEEKLMKARRLEEERIARLTQAEREKAQKAFLEKKKLDEKELVTSFYEKKMVPTFNTTPVEKASPPSDYLTKTSAGFDIAFESSGSIGTPTIVNDQMFIPAGFYSPSFYCLSALTGQYVWGVQLGESGASPAVYHNGVLLINTYSCTLYAIDAVTGRLLWSKWLAGTVYSTPTADGDKVYVVYHYGGAYVLSCFDLRSGEFKWINRLDSETIACPVVEGNEVHVASQTGFYYIFDKETGKPIDVITSFKAVSSPTLTPESIFLTAEVGGREQLIVLDRITHKEKKRYDATIRPVNIEDNHNCSDQMNFNGSHPIVYKNKYVVLLDEEKLFVFDALSERLLWEKPVNAASSQVPIVAENQIIVADDQGKLLSFDITTGDSKQVANMGDGIASQPVYNKGFLFIASTTVLSAIKSIQTFKWNQWNMDARHNLNIK